MGLASIIDNQWTWSRISLDDLEKVSFLIDKMWIKFPSFQDCYLNERIDIMYLALWLCIVGDKVMSIIPLMFLPFLTRCVLLYGGLHSGDGTARSKPVFQRWGLLRVRCRHATPPSPDTSQKKEG